MKRRIERFSKRSETIGHEQAALKFALTDTNLDEGTFKGIASVFGNIVDAWMPTIIEPGAFKKTLKDQAGRIKLLWQHDPHEPIGVPLALQETAQGLELMGKISQTARGKDCLTLMRDGVISELSIGFDPIKWEMEDKGSGDVIRHVKEVKLWEISAVTFAADNAAKIQAVHSLEFADTISEIPLDAFLLPPPNTEANESRAPRAANLFDLVTALIEIHEGKVLSTKNKKLLQDAVAALSALIATAEPPEEDKPAQGTSKQALTGDTERHNQLREAELAFAHLSQP